jgi:hypothetical protein
MGEMMGDSETFGTWGAMRCPFFNDKWSDNSVPPNFFDGKYLHSREYLDEGDGVNYPPTYFVDNSGSLFRSQPLGFGFIGPSIYWPQTGSMPSFWDGYMRWSGMDNKDFDEFVGAALVSPTDSVTLDASASTTPGQYVEYTPPLTIDLYPGFTTIGGMTVIT